MNPITVLDPDCYATAAVADNGMPHAQYTWLRENAPLFDYRLDDPDLIDRVWVVSRYDDVVSILRDTGAYSSAEGSGLRRFDPTCAAHGGKPAMVSLDGAEHRRNRGVVSRSFTPAVVRTFERTFRELAAAIVENAVRGEYVDFVDDVATKLPLFAICDLVGVPESDRGQILDWTNTLTVPSDPDMSPSVEAAIEAVTGIWSYGLQLARTRRAEPRTDMMTTIVEALERGELTEDEVMGFMLSLTAAGNETTRNTTTHALLALLQDQDQMAWLRAQGVVPASAVEEMLRWSSPVVHSRRTLTTTRSLHGVQLPPRTAVAVLYPAANFDPSVFADPLALDLTRNPNPHVTFASGPHVCLGAHIARLEVRILFEELLARTSRIERTGDVAYMRDARLRGVKSLPVRLVAA